MPLPLPYQYMGVPSPGLEDVKDPEKLLRLLPAMQQQHAATQENIDSVVTSFPLMSSHLIQSVHLSDTASSTLTLTTALQDVPGVSITLPWTASAYLLLYVFDFAVGPAGVGQCIGVAKVGSTVLGNAAHFQLGASGDEGVATIGNFHVASGAKGDAVTMQARKTINAGTAQVSNVNTRLSVFGPL